MTNLDFLFYVLSPKNNLKILNRTYCYFNCQTFKLHLKMYIKHTDDNII